MIFKFREIFICFVFCLCVLLIGGASARAQSSAFTFQGKLTDNSVAANGVYQMRFALFDAANNQIGATVTVPDVAVSNGVFTVTLDFTQAAFTGANRFLQISVFSTANGAFVDLSPRQIITAAPYAVRSLTANIADNAVNADNLGSIPAGGFVQTGDARLTDARTPVAGSANYIQNQNAAAQSSANFNINGSGTVGGTLSGGIVNAGTQYNLGGLRILSINGNGNLFAGANTGTGNVGGFNSFFGSGAGGGGNEGSNNSFFGASSGGDNTVGADNAFYGSASGRFNSTGIGNAFFGAFSGRDNLTGGNNSFFGRLSGFFNQTGSENTFFGSEAGKLNTSGGGNVFLGRAAGFTNVTGNNNTIVGAGANVGASGLVFAAAVGAGATVNTNNTVVLGRTADDVRVPGNLVVVTLGAAGSTSLCRNANNEISTCTAGSFAENTAALDALNRQNAEMRQQIKQQQTTIDELKKLVCLTNAQSPLCRD